MWRRTHPGRVIKCIMGTEENLSLCSYGSILNFLKRPQTAGSSLIGCLSSNWPPNSPSPPRLLEPHLCQGHCFSGCSAFVLSFSDNGVHLLLQGSHVDYGHHSPSLHVVEVQFLFIQSSLIVWSGQAFSALDSQFRLHESGSGSGVRLTEEDRNQAFSSLFSFDEGQEEVILVLSSPHGGGGRKFPPLLLPQSVLVHIDFGNTDLSSSGLLHP